MSPKLIGIITSLKMVLQLNLWILNIAIVLQGLSDITCGKWEVWHKADFIIMMIRIIAWSEYQQSWVLLLLLWSGSLPVQNINKVGKVIILGLSNPGKEKFSWSVWTLSQNLPPHSKSEYTNLYYLVFWFRWHPTPGIFPGKSHGRRSLVGCSPWSL